LRLHRPRALIVDKDSSETTQLVAFLTENGFEVHWAKDGEQAFNVLDRPVPETAGAPQGAGPEVLITELRAHRVDGMRLLEIAKTRNPEVCAILIADGGTVELATDAMRQGAYDFQLRPLNFPKLLAVIQRALSHQQLVGRVSDLTERLDVRLNVPNLTGSSRVMQELAAKVIQIAPTRATVLIHGETGTGKELIAQAIHQLSPRKNERFVKLQCAELSANIIESELFGHEKGAFTGADQQRKGRFELADQGTLFIDEISEIPPAIQTKLLRVLQDRQFERVGGNETVKVDVRVIAATNRRLDLMAAREEFREDLYYRLRVIQLEVAPLRERKEDIPPLVEVFIREFNREHGRRVTGITRGVADRFMEYDWPGNVRELRNTIEEMVVFAQGKRPLEVTDLPIPLREHRAASAEDLNVSVGMSMHEIERRAIEATLRSVGHDKQKAAKILGIGLRTLYRKQKEYGL
ncbi:MAG: sigma-54-dependent Fis family transcriptional regulator, partial [Candidatus Latescibacteria bacterium]|nr:sigma-54-dependent Fis family transcriptional regulator [Candidatus Latescibacterota bacterium]